MPDEEEEEIVLGDLHGNDEQLENQNVE